MRVWSVVLGLSLLLAGVTCAPATTTPIGVTPLANTAAGGAPAVLALGEYACRISDHGYNYPAFRCIARDDGGRTVVEKVEGSVRFRGVAVAARGGFELHGEVYCPWGDCTEPVRAVFHPLGGGSFVGEFPGRQAGPPMMVTLEPLGHGYGGGAYGGYGYGYYGGYGYGGHGYGGHGYGGGRGGY